MKKSNHLSVLFALVAAFSSARATTVIPPTFDELVERAEVIFQGEVTDVKSQWMGEGAQRHIVSYVTFKVEDGVKGNPGQSYTIRMFGGTVDGYTMAVSDGPKFQVGEKDILFVENNGSQFIPLVGIMHGRFHVRKDQSGREIVTGSEDEPVKNLARLGKESTAPANESAEVELTPADFKAAVREKIQKQDRDHVQQ
jgi:hypothetical protein